MMRMRYILAVLALAIALPAVPGQAQEDKVRELMHKKLQMSQKILEGIALEDYGKVRDGADELVLISKATSWRVFKTPQYELHSNDFRRSAETLSKMADAKNVDGAALAYVDMTLTCVRCHKYVREVRMVRAND